MIDFHTHSILSDGALIPSELVRRATVLGYRAIGLTDHVDGSNLDFLVPRAINVANDLNRFQETLVVPGAEITHAPPRQIPSLVERARALGALLVVVHGESPVEPVPPGTNWAGIESGVDILAHPGFITPAEVEMAKAKGVFLEITARMGHNITNGHVARLCREIGAPMVINTDTHSPENLITRGRAVQILVGAGLSDAEAEEVLENNERLFQRFSRLLRDV
ncbi:MAG: histidinol phosphate phosphatase domain-containing protein [Thermodesulfobacteriota bacterium]